MENNSTKASIFGFRDRLIRKRESFFCIIVKIQAPGIKHRVDAECDAELFWPDSLFQITPLCELAERVQGLSSHGEPFPYGLDRCAELRADLDAYHSRVYRLAASDEPCDIFDPSDVMSPGHPVEILHFLKDRELSEYRTRRHVLEVCGCEEAI